MVGNSGRESSSKPKGYTLVESLGVEYGTETGYSMGFLDGSVQIKWRDIQGHLRVCIREGGHGYGTACGGRGCSGSDSDSIMLFSLRCWLWDRILFVMEVVL